jgi:hypothetical protein
MFLNFGNDKKEDFVTAAFPLCPGFSLPIAGAVSQLRTDASLFLCNLFGVDFFIQGKAVKDKDSVGVDVLVPAMATKIVNRADIAYFEVTRKDRKIVMHKTVSGDLTLALASPDLTHCDSLDCKSLEQLTADAVDAETEMQRGTPKDSDKKEEALQLLQGSASTPTLEAAPGGPQEAGEDGDASTGQTTGATKTKTAAFTFHLACHCLTPLRDVDTKVKAIGLKEHERIKKIGATALQRKLKDAADGYAMVRIHAESQVEIDKAMAAVCDPNRIPLNKLVTDDEKTSRSARAKAMADALAAAEAIMAPSSSMSQTTTPSAISKLGLQGALESFQRDGCMKSKVKAKPAKKGAASDLLKIGRHMLR